VAGRELHVIVSHATRENSRCVGRVQLLVDNVKVYEAHDFELETAQLSPRQPYVIEERLPTDVEAECKNKSETDGSERRHTTKAVAKSQLSFVTSGLFKTFEDYTPQSVRIFT